MTLPARDSLATYGGALNDYFPVTDPTTDRSAAGANQAYASTAMMTLMCPRAWVKFTAGPSPVLVQHMAVWGNLPLVTPTIAHTGTGTYTVTWPATIQDQLNVVQVVNLIGATNPNCESLTTTAYVTLSANVATVNVGSSGTASDVATTLSFFVF